MQKNLNFLSSYAFESSLLFQRRDLFSWKKNSFSLYRKHLFSFEFAIFFPLLLCSTNSWEKKSTKRNIFWIMKASRGRIWKIHKYIRGQENKTLQEREHKNKSRELNIMQSYENCIIIQLHKSYLIFFLWYLLSFFVVIIDHESFFKEGELHRLGKNDNVFYEISHAGGRIIAQKYCLGRWGMENCTRFMSYIYWNIKFVVILIIVT